MIRWPMRMLGGQFGAVQLLQRGLVVEQVDVRRPAGHEQIDDALGLGGKVQCRQDPGAALGGRRGGQQFGIQQRGQRRSADSRTPPGRTTGGGSTADGVLARDASETILSSVFRPGSGSHWQPSSRRPVRRRPAGRRAALRRRPATGSRLRCSAGRSPAAAGGHA